MNTQTTLSGLLLVQLGLAAVTWWPESTAPIETKKLVPEGGNSITQVTIARPGDDTPPVELAATDGKWAITSANGFPADAEKIGEVVDALGGIELGEPITTNATSHGQLKVAADDFGKKVTFTAGGQVQTVFIGAAASKAIYLRVDGSDDVWKVKGPSEFTFKETNRSYWSTNFVQFNKDDATSFRIVRDAETWAFGKNEGAWQVNDRPVLGPKLDELIGKAAAMRLSEPVGVEIKPEYALGAGAVQIEWTVAEGESTVSGAVTVGAEVDSKYYVQKRGEPFIVQVPAYVLKPILEAKLEDLIDPAAPPPTPAGATPAPPAPGDPLFNPTPAPPGSGGAPGGAPTAPGAAPSAPGGAPPPTP
jgi:hypothetical protein